MEHGARSTDHKARSTKHGDQSTEHNARPQSTEHKARSTKHGTRVCKFTPKGQVLTAGSREPAVKRALWYPLWSLGVPRGLQGDPLGVP